MPALAPSKSASLPPGSVGGARTSERGPPSELAGAHGAPHPGLTCCLAASGLSSKPLEAQPDTPDAAVGISALDVAERDNGSSNSGGNDDSGSGNPFAGAQWPFAAFGGRIVRCRS